MSNERTIETLERQSARYLRDRARLVAAVGGALVLLNRARNELADNRNLNDAIERLEAALDDTARGVALTFEDDERGLER